MDLTNGENAVSASLFSPVLLEFFYEDDTDHLNHIAQLKTKVLKLENVNFTINSKWVIIQMKSHEQ